MYQYQLSLSHSFFPPGFRNYSKPCEPNDLLLCWQHASEKPQSNIPEFLHLVDIVMQEENLQAPDDTFEALTLYFDLIRNITN